jgi:hypothetical protein
VENATQAIATSDERRCIYCSIEIDDNALCAPLARRMLYAARCNCVLPLFHEQCVLREWFGFRVRSGLPVPRRQQRCPSCNERVVFYNSQWAVIVAMRRRVQNSRRSTAAVSNYMRGVFPNGDLPDERDFPLQTLGRLTNRCPGCDARFFVGESMNCCGPNYRVVLPRETNPPPELLRMFFQTDPQLYDYRLACLWRDNSRQFNNAMAFGCQIINRDSFGRHYNSNGRHTHNTEL